MRTLNVTPAPLAMALGGDSNLHIATDNQPGATADSVSEYPAAWTSASAALRILRGPATGVDLPFGLAFSPGWADVRRQCARLRV